MPMSRDKNTSKSIVVHVDKKSCWLSVLPPISLNTHKNTAVQKSKGETPLILTRAMLPQVSAITKPATISL
jgi:hypothetical protein